MQHRLDNRSLYFVNANNTLCPFYVSAYFPIMTIPKGARSITVKEATLSPSYIAVKSSGGNYYLNGGWRVSWPGRSVKTI